ncbi:MAG: Transcriptional regulator of sugar metabolism [Caldanaerobacter subterraneus]|jgi:DeoR family glycerol-3-phosphate regulon repressor|uniref:DeoR family transcriptional regulator n=1 Tax=Caldanaerobacter subterraneus TaxID=911092 RepID=A0A101E572_9THEO|nr:MULTISPECIES: DeoR/GlpR family DNA-binding transcription regulator [Caldanaerobacter]KUK09132.1 MAG: Transcriptional regulator of sugar metabolism [Caldanaerobacter subterraneus]MDI3518498.1 DeoR family transcriptional regulator, glycerol-3-phosphate regulon repressor [Caldanaerobacter sp.]MDK2794684.1 DeoR family transcriptional regulator, glycerol-3-phosphate regulon repressor [Caldanaerobacter sp.]TCO68138.1 DeoR family transcriptional regulator [Caldanaerobacter subterraneus]HBT48462.1 
MLVSTRREKIKEIILKKKAVKVSELCEIFKVSDETIRRDLEELERQGLIERNYGGAVLKENIVVPPLVKRFKEHIEEKQRIAAKAVTEIKEGNVIFLDAGSTTYHIAKAIKSLKGITVITNALNVATELSTNPDINLFITGGKLKHDNQSMVGFETVNCIGKYNIDILFLGTGGISVEKGLTTSDIFEAEAKKAMIRSASRVIVVADSSKFGKVAMVSFATFNDIEKIITAGEENREIVEQLTEYVKIEIV